RIHGADRVPFVIGVEVFVVKAVISGNHLVDFLFGYLVKIASLGLIVEERNGVIDFAHITRRKVLAHNRERNEYLQVAGVVVTVTDALQGPNHLKANAVKQNRRADGRPPAEKNAPSFV